MAFIAFNDIGIAGISACVPKDVAQNSEIKDLLTEKALKKTIKTTGIKQRRISNESQCSSDFCYEAAQKLFDDLDFDRADIDILIFISQTPDYILPATATILQDRLGLPTTTAAFDINLGCSGYVYGLSTAFAYASMPDVKNVLLLVGDTPTKFVNSKDRSTALLFGDGGSASIINKNEKYGKSCFSLNSDGSGKDSLYIKSGAFRHQSSPESLQENTFEDGSVRTDHQLYMKGADIFNFTINRIPSDIQALFSNYDINPDEIDYIVYHQANKFITDFLTSKLDISLDKVPYCLDKYGNTSCLTIPLTIVSELKESLANGKDNLILCGFGVGLSWATANLKLNDTFISEIVEI